MDYVERNKIVDKLNIQSIKHLLHKSGISNESKYKSNNIIKNIVDKLYFECEKELHSIIRKWNCYQIIIESMNQLDNWTDFFNNEDLAITSTILDIYKIHSYARYSWQFIIELCISRYIMNKDKLLRVLEYDTLEILFTYTVYMGYFSSISDELHFYNDQHKDSILSYDDIVNLRYPKGSINYSKLTIKETSYINEIPDYDKYPIFEPSFDNIKHKEKINWFLLKHFNFSYNNVVDILKVLVNMSEYRVLIVDSFEHLIDLIQKESNMKTETIKSALNFISYKYRPNLRQFLQRSETYRMVNFSSVILPRTKKLKSLFGNYTSSINDIVKAKEYILISPFMTIEWLDRFTYRFINGKIEYLLNTEEMKIDAISIEKFFHIDIFEKEFDKLLINKNILTIRSLKKINGKIIQCGEIDLLSYSIDENRLSFFELKCFAHIVDIKSKRQVYNNYYGSKNYHLKILKKIKWVNSNIDVIIKMFEKKYDITIKSTNINMEYYNITWASNYLKYSIENYQIMRFDEYLNRYY